mgnify:CR=1 FL=1
MEDSQILSTLENDEDIELNSENNDEDELENEFDDNLIYTEKLENNSEDDIVLNKNNIVIIDKDKRKTLPILTKYEITRIISIRSSQIENGAEPCIKVESNNPIKIAKLELLMGESPLILRRKLYNNYYEEWKIKELKIINVDVLNKLIF